LGALILIMLWVIIYQFESIREEQRATRREIERLNAQMKQFVAGLDAILSKEKDPYEK